MSSSMQIEHARSSIFIDLKNSSSLPGRILASGLVLLREGRKRVLSSFFPIFKVLLGCLLAFVFLGVV